MVVMACLATKESADKLSKKEGCDENSCVLESMLTEFMEMTMQTNEKSDSCGRLVNFAISWFT